MTDAAIIEENTVIKQEHIYVIRSFQIPFVEVESVLSNGQRFTPKEVIEEKVEITLEINQGKSFSETYKDTVEQYKKLFLQWQAGTKVEMIRVRECLTPLLELAIQGPKELLTIQNYNKEGDYIYHHAVSVGALSAFMAKKLNYSKQSWVQVGLSGALADIGMAKIPLKLLNKKVALNQLEFAEVKKHPIYSYNMLKDVKGVSDDILLGVLQHHERIDQSGYPLQTNKEKIHSFSQLIAVADVYHAMTSDRIYRRKQSPYYVLGKLTEGQFDKFNPKVIQVFCESIASLLIGSNVRLNNGDQAKIVYFDHTRSNSSVVELLETGEMIAITSNHPVTIEEYIS